jgi:amino acid adenylation domain-containing protein
MGSTSLFAMPEEVSFDLSDVATSISKRFERIVVSYQDRLAIHDQQKYCTYGSLNRLANRIGRKILAECKSDDCPVVLFFNQGISQIAATLGTLKAGKFYLPMDPSNPISRNQHIASDSGAECIVTDGDNFEFARQLLPDSGCVINIDEIEDTVSDRNFEIATTSESLAYVLYTSGSTGRPKGVMHNHANVLHNVFRHTKFFGIKPDDRQSLLYTSSVYGGQRDVFNALLNGASLECYKTKTEGIVGLANWLIENKVTIYCSVATIFRQFIKTVDGTVKFPHLRLIKLGGEATYNADIDAFKQYLSPECVMHCGLGSTETGLARNYFVTKETEIAGAAVPLGFPVDGLDVVLLDESGKEASIGEIGEILIKSRYISLGYWRNPEITESVFSTDPSDPGLRIYRTGDLGCIDADHCLEHRGRKDFQIKIKGNRVETAEIQMALQRQVAVDEAVVTGWKDHQGIDKIVAYVVAGGDKPNTSTLRHALAAELPDYMVPSIFIWLDSLPRLPHGKLDRQALPEPNPQSVEPSGNYVAPDSPLEQELAMIWVSILGQTQISRFDDFFDLGGDSMAAMMMFAALEEKLGVNLPFSILIESSTIASLSEAIRSSTGLKQWPVIVPFNTTGDKPPLFCVHGIFGGILFYKSLLPHLPGDQPLYALQPEFLNGKRYKYDSIESIAACYLEEIKKIQPDGPYSIAGFSFGGQIALEITRQLIARGEEVEPLIVFDSTPPSTVMKAGRPVSSKLSFSDGGGKRFDLAKLSHYSWSSKVSKIVSGLINYVNTAKRWIAYKLAHFFLNWGYTLPSKRRAGYINWNHQRVSNNYSPAPCSCDIVLFCTFSRKSRLPRAWEHFSLGEVITYHVAGDHKSIFYEPNVANLSVQLCRELAKRGSRSSDSTDIAN